MNLNDSSTIINKKGFKNQERLATRFKDLHRDEILEAIVSIISHRFIHDAYLFCFKNNICLPSR